MLTITQLRKYEGGQWHSDTLDALPDKISEDSILWVDAEDPSEAEMTQLRSHFELDNLKLEELNKEGRRAKVKD